MIKINKTVDRNDMNQALLNFADAVSEKNSVIN